MDSILPHSLMLLLSRKKDELRTASYYVLGLPDDPWICIAGDLDCGIVSRALLIWVLGSREELNLLCHCSELWVCADGQKEGGRKGYCP